MPKKKPRTKTTTLPRYFRSYFNRRKILAIVGATGLLSAGASAALPVVSPQSYAHPISILGQVTKQEDCIVAQSLPDSACTPGAILKDATASDVCRPGYASFTRSVSEATKNKVFQEYGIHSREKGQYEVDHLVSLELGGSNDISNLWPESASPVPGFHQKDSIENELHRRVCSGAMSLKKAQDTIAHHWVGQYLEYVR